MLTTIFADSFAHYNQAGIPLKWDSAGGAIETNPAHVRTGPQSLRIQAGSSPLKSGLGGNGYSVIGFAWQTDTLAGETICSLVDSGSGHVQVFLVQNANGSISLWQGAGGPTLIGTTAAGVLTTGVFWYIEISINLNSSFPITCLLTVTSPLGVASQALSETGFSTSQSSWDTLTWGGPVAPNHAWVADFYNQSLWDSAGNPLAVMGAPQIYGLSVPVSDGLDLVAFNTIGKTIAFPGTAAPWWPQVNEIPQSTAAPIFETDQSVNSPGTIGGWIVCGQAFVFSPSGIPATPIGAVQVVILYAASAGDNANENSFGCIQHQSSDPPNFFQVVAGTGIGLNAGQSKPFAFYEFPFDLNPFTSAPFTLSQFVGSNALQFGPYIGEPA